MAEGEREILGPSLRSFLSSEEMVPDHRVPPLLPGTEVNRPGTGEEGLRTFFLNFLDRRAHRKEWFLLLDFFFLHPRLVSSIRPFSSLPRKGHIPLGRAQSSRMVSTPPP